MIIEVTFKNEEEKKFVAYTSSNNTLLASVVNLMPNNFDAMSEEERKSGTV